MSYGLYGGGPLALMPSAGPNAASLGYGDFGDYQTDAYTMQKAMESDAGIPWKEAAKYTDIVWAKSSDNNNGSYTNNQLTMQTGVVNSFVIWKYAYIAMPVTIMATVCSPDVRLLQNPIGAGWQKPVGCPYSVGFKNGAWQMVDTGLFTFCGKTLNNTSRFLNALNTFRALTETSPAALKVISKSWQFYPDDFDSATLNMSNQSSGAICAAGGYLNNNVVDPAILNGSCFFALTGVSDQTAPTNVTTAFLTNNQWQGYPFKACISITCVATATNSVHIGLPLMRGTGGASQFSASSSPVSLTTMYISPNAHIQVSLQSAGGTVNLPTNVDYTVGLLNGSTITPTAPTTYTACTAQNATLSNAIAIRISTATASALTAGSITNVSLMIWEPSLASPMMLPSGNFNPITGSINTGLINRSKYWAYSNPLGIRPAIAPNLTTEFRDGYIPGPGGPGASQSGPTYPVATTGASSTGSTATLQLYRAIIKLPLMFLHDIFDQLDYPMAGTRWDMTLVLNQVSSATINACTTHTSGGCSGTGFLSGGLTCPIIVTNLGTAQNSTATLVAADPTSAGFPNHSGTMNFPSAGMSSGGIQAISVYVGNAPGSVSIPTNVVTTAGGGPNAFLNQCFLYYPVVGLPFNPLARISAEVSSTVYEKKVRYLDHQWIQSPNVYAPSQTYQWFITSDVIGLQYLLVFAFIDISSMASTEQVTPYASCTSAEPGTMSPQSSLTNFNIMVDDFSYFVNPLNYTYETWLHAVRQFFPNDAQDTIISAGLLNQHDWENGYRVYAFDLSRAPVSKRAGKLFFNFTNNSPYTVQLHALPIASKRLEITYTPGASTPMVNVLQGDF